MSGPNHNQADDWPAFHRQTNAEVIVSTCREGHSVAAPNKGLGRAKVAAWESQHQHRGEVSS